jgi:hypothetical protein
MKRHLIYHVCPLKGNDIWLKNLDQLAKRWSAFDGTKNFAVVQGEGLHDEDVVFGELAGRGMEDGQTLHVTAPNDKRLREVATFMPLLETIRGLDGCAFYAHTKGNSTKDGVAGATRWRNAMYHHLLGKASECTRRLEDGASMVGTNKMLWTSPTEHERRTLPRPTLRKSPYPTRLDNKFQWMFAGTFFWFRLDRVFSNPRWKDVANDRYGAEAWPGQMFPHDECHSMWDPFHPRHALSPYDPKYYSPEFDDPC